MKSKKFAEIVWLDAVAYDRAGRELEEKTPAEMLFPIKSYGYVLKEDKKAIVLAYEDSQDVKSFIVIPNKWIKSIRYGGSVKEILHPSNFNKALARRRSLRWHK